MEFTSNIVSQVEGLAQDFEDIASGHHLQVTTCKRMERSRILRVDNRIICDNLRREKDSSVIMYITTENYASTNNKV